MKYEIIKGGEKDFEGAPEWATKLLGETCVSKKAFAGDLGGVAMGAYKENPSYWWKLNERNIATIIAERRPITEPVWSGEGLPPVGVECELKSIEYADFDWVRVKVVFEHNGELVVIVNMPDYSIHECMSKHSAGYDGAKFRPIRSPEDVARDDGIKEIMQALRIDGELAPDYVACAMWDAGYRKNPEVSTDDMWREFEKNSDMEDVHKLIYGDKGK